MPINPLQIPQSNINNTVDPSMWASLGNLGNVYQAAQDKQKLQSTLAALGDDPKLNQQLLLGSGVPSLAQLGLSLQEKGVEQGREDKRYAITDKRAEEALAIQQHQDARAQATADQADEDRANAAKIVAAFTAAGQTPPPAAVAAAAPAFPAALPGAQPAPQAAPIAPSPAVPAPAAPAAPSAFSATPIVPGGLQPGPATPAPAIPVKAEGDDGELPGWVQSAQAAPPATSLVGRMANNLTSPSPAAAAGISREQLAAAYANPITRPLATAFLQKQFSPGEWKYENVDGRIIATNTLDPSKTKDVTPPTPSGAPPMSKEERETQGYLQAGKNLGMTDDQATAFAANKGKAPKDDLSVHDRKAIDDNDNIYMSANTAIDNIKRLQDLSPKAFQGFGASALGTLTGQTGEGAGTATAEYNNIALRNVVAMVKSAFPRPTEYETKLMQRIETGADMPRNVRDDLLVDLQKQLQMRADQARSKSEAIRNSTYYKPGGGLPATSDATADTPSATTAPTAPTAPTAKPSLGDFMKRARDANPGASDGDLARYWKDKYGG